MRVIIKDSRIEFIPEKEIDRTKLAQIPEGSNEAFVYTTLDGGDEGNQEALVIHIGPIPTEEEVLSGAGMVIACLRCGSPFYNTIKGAECRKCGYVVPLGEKKGAS